MGASKRVYIVVKLVKAYNHWVKKSTEVEFQSAYSVLLVFSQDEPMCDVELPPCIQVDIQEMQFNCGLLDN